MLAAHAILLAAVMLALMIAAILTGRSLGLYHLRIHPDKASLSSPAIEAALFALLGLIIAFTFSGAASRFDLRRNLLIQETNAIGTAWLRIDLLPEAAQPAMRDDFRAFTDARIAFYKALPDESVAREVLARQEKIQNKIWLDSVSLTRGQLQSNTVLPALNQMFDTAAVSSFTPLIHPPFVIYILLFSLALACSLLTGYGMARTKNIQVFSMTLFTIMMAISLWVIVDLEYPRAGLIRLDDFDHLITDLRASMK